MELQSFTKDFGIEFAGQPEQTIIRFFTEDVDNGEIFVGLGSLDTSHQELATEAQVDIRAINQTGDAGYAHSGRHNNFVINGEASSILYFCEPSRRGRIAQRFAQIMDGQAISDSAQTYLIRWQEKN